ncbi:MAG: radical SAM protein [Candidatus Eiseniibacteriota bacterium]|nr:MAG: radical SAM protein [Candidatus Eisenbacteria bacterium]
MKPTSAVLAVTYRCNSRCETCDIWRKGPGKELRPEDFRRLPDGLRNINVSGGEPFLRDDLVDVVRVLKETYPKATLVISTNGLAPERIEREVRKMGRVGVRVSVDAVGALGDEVRGVKGAFDLAMETVDRLAALGVSDLGISSTISQRTVGDLRKLKRIAESRGIEFVTNLVHSSPTYFGEHGDKIPAMEALEKELLWLRGCELSSRRPKDWFRSYLTDGMIDQLAGRKRRIRCHAGRYLFFMSPEGDIYPCNIWPEKMGNILEESYEEMVARCEGMFEKIDRCGVQCWMSCTVAPAMRRRPLGSILWVVTHKLSRSKT